MFPLWPNIRLEKSPLPLRSDEHEETIEEIVEAIFEKDDENDALNARWIQDPFNIASGTSTQSTRIGSRIACGYVFRLVGL